MLGLRRGNSSYVVQNKVRVRHRNEGAIIVTCKRIIYDEKNSDSLGLYHVETNKFNILCTVCSLNYNEQCGEVQIPFHHVKF